jgi:PKD repeat protein
MIRYSPPFSPKAVIDTLSPDLGEWERREKMISSNRPGTRSNLAVPLGFLAAILLLGWAVPAGAQFDIHDLGYTVTTQDIQADLNNTVHIVWTSGSVLYYGKIIGNAISGTVEVATGVDTLYWRPYFSVQPNGESVHIAWTSTGMGNKLMHSWKTSGQWATETVMTAPGSQWLSQPTCAIDSSGILHVMFAVWNNVPSDEWATIFYTRKLASGKWEEKARFAPQSPEYKNPMLFVDSGGRVHATWAMVGNSGSDSYDAYYCSTPSGGQLSYGNMVRLPKAADCNVNGYGDLYVDRNGVVHRSIGCWSNARQKMCIDHTQKPVGGKFSPPTRPSIGFLDLDAGDPVPAVTASEDGQVVVAWGQCGPNGSNTVKASFYDPDQRAWSLYTVDPAAGIPTSSNTYRVAITRTDERVYLVWRGGNRHLQLVNMPFGNPGPPPPPGDEEPVASFTASPASGMAPLSVTFDASSSYDPDGNIVSYDWDFGDGATGVGVITSHVYATTGTYEARLTVTDNDGLTGSAVESIQAISPNEVPHADFQFSPSTGIYPCQITFDAGSSHDPDGTIVQYSWNFGDSSHGSGRVVTHTYNSWGTFFVSLTVRDNSDITDTKVKPIEILRLFKPLNIRWESHKDESLFQIRFVNQVTWERNPANDNLGVQIIRHRIWRKKAGETDYAYLPIGEVSGDIYSYLDSNAGSEEGYVYTVTACDNQGHESPIVGGVENTNPLLPSRDFRSLSRKIKIGGK